MVADNVYFDYKPLPPNHIRLLKVKPSHWTDPYAQTIIELDVFEVDLLSAPKFNALSYTWGPPTLEIDKERLIFSQEPRCYPFRCRGKILRGTRNLRDALWRLRATAETHAGVLIKRELKANTGLPIWVDALCINQDDISERNSQVAIMAQIYESAESVLAWLGEQDTYSRTALSVCRRTWKLSQSHPIDSDKFERDPKDTFYYMTLLKQTFTDDEFLCLSMFLKRHWFSRSWILQEVAMSKSLVLLCGTVGLTWYSIVAVCKYLAFSNISREMDMRVYEYARAHPDLQSYLTTIVFKPASLTDFSRLLLLDGIKTRLADRAHTGMYESHSLILNTTCTDPRDKVFALLGISKDLSEGDARIRPDYTTDIDKLYTTAWYMALRKQGNLKLLHTYQNPVMVSKHQGLPTWCPDFSQSGSQLTFIQPGDPSPWQADKSLSMCKWTIELVGRAIRLKGVKISLLTEVLDLRNGTGTEPLECAQLINMVSRLPPTKEFYGSAQESRFEVLWRTLIAGCLVVKDIAPKSVEKAVRHYFEGAGMSFHSRDGKNPDAEAKSLADVHDAFEKLRAVEKRNKKDIPDLKILRDMLSQNENATRSRSKFVSPTDMDTETLQRVFGVSDEDYQKMAAWASRRDRVVSRRNAFSTDDGCLGLSANCSQVGDEVWILNGMVTPCVLRPIADGRHQFLGEAYVHGIMQGEAVLDHTELTTVEIE